MQRLVKKVRASSALGKVARSSNESLALHQLEALAGWPPSCHVTNPRGQPLEEVGGHGFFSPPVIPLQGWGWFRRSAHVANYSELAFPKAHLTQAVIGQDELKSQVRKV